MSTYMSLAQYMAGTPIPEVSISSMSSSSKRFGAVTYDQLVPAEPAPTPHLFSSVVMEQPDSDFLLPHPPDGDGGDPGGGVGVGGVSGVGLRALHHEPGTWGSAASRRPAATSTVVVAAGVPQVHRATRRYGSLESETSLVSEEVDSMEDSSSGTLEDELYAEHVEDSARAARKAPCSTSLVMPAVRLPGGVPWRTAGPGYGRRRGSLMDSPGSSASWASSSSSTCTDGPPGGDSSAMSVHDLAAVPSALDTVLEITKQASLIAQSIGQAFQVAYMEFLKANGIDDPGLMKEMDYQEVLNQQEIFGEELFLFSNKDMQKEVIAPKLKGEPLGVVVVESGWGSMVPTVVLANMSPSGAAARCGQLNIGDQIMSINGISLVGLPLSTCQNYIKAAKNQTVVKLTVVSCPPVVEVLIKRPDVKYQLGFSVQNGVICSLLRGGIAERGGVRVGHRIIEINGQSVVAVPHEKIVNMLATSVGEIHMKTMPTSIFRLLTGQETPHYI